MHICILFLLFFLPLSLTQPSVSIFLEHSFSLTWHDYLLSLSLLPCSPVLNTTLPLLLDHAVSKRIQQLYLTLWTELNSVPQDSKRDRREGRLVGGVKGEGLECLTEFDLQVVGGDSQCSQTSPSHRFTSLHSSATNRGSTQCPML